MFPAEPTLLDAFKANPFFMALSVLLGAAGLVLAIVGLALALRGSRAGLVVGIAAALNGLGAVGVGAVGTMVGRAHVEAVLAAPGLAEKDKERLRVYGEAEASYSLKLGLGAGLLPLLGGVAAVVIAGKRRQK